MILLVHFALLVIALAYLITESAIMHLPRIIIARLSPMSRVLVYCPMCISFWSGIALAALGCAPLGGWDESSPSMLDIAACLLVHGMAAMAIAHIWSRTTGGNAMYEIESPLIDRDRETDDTPTSSQERPHE